MAPAPRAEKRLADVIGGTFMAARTMPLVDGRTGNPIENAVKRLFRSWIVPKGAADSTVPHGPKLSPPRCPLITMGVLFVYVAYALWFLLLYTFAVLVLQHASGLALPNPFALLPWEYRHYLPFSS